MRILHLLPIFALPLLLACPSPQAVPCGIGGEPSIAGGHPLDPFPSMHLMTGEGDDPSGCRLALDTDTIPVGASRPMDVASLNRRDGFSPAGTLVWQPGVAVDPGSLTPLSDPGLSLEPGAAVQLFDLDTGERLPCFAELDAWPDQQDTERALLIRPMRGMGFEARIGVAITDALVDPQGQPVAAPEPFATLRDGGRDGVSDAVRAHYGELLARLEELGVERDRLVLAWDFRTASHASLTAPLDRVLATMREELPLDPAFEPEVVISEIADADAGDSIPAGLWREVRGSLRLTHWLWAESGADDAPDDEHDAGVFRLDAEGLPVPRGADDAFFTAALPDSIRGADPGTVPVLVFGHGIFANPGYYVASSSDENGVVDLCNRLGAICIGGEWRGLTTRDVADALRVANDLGRFPLITDKMVQGVSNQMALARVLRTAFVEAEWLQAEAGGSLVDTERIHYMGISLGGIEGATLMANTEVVDYGVLHVPGAVWATMLERSSHWASFEAYVAQTQPDPAHRQRIYALTQLLWDPVDPVNHADALSGRSVLWQIAIGDEQVPNFTAEIMARTTSAPQVGDPVDPVWGLESVAAPTEPDSRGVAQFDGGFVRPAGSNRPAEVTGAHTAIRHTDEMKDQVVAFFAEGQEGTIIHPCDGPCVFDLTDE